MRLLFPFLRDRIRQNLSILYEIEKKYGILLAEIIFLCKFALRKLKIERL